MHLTNPRWQMAAILKKSTKNSLFASVYPILMKFGMMMHLVPTQPNTVKISGI